MSWQDYVDKQLLASRCVTKAAIAGHDGNLWAKSEGFEVSNATPLRLSAETSPPLSLFFPPTAEESFSHRTPELRQEVGGRGTR